MKNFLHPTILLKILVFHNLFCKGFCQRLLYFKNINFLTKFKRCLYTFVKSKLTKMTGKDKQNHIFQKKEYLVQKYILERTENLLFMYFTGVSHYTMKSIQNLKNI